MHRQVNKNKQHKLSGRKSKDHWEGDIFLDGLIAPFRHVQEGKRQQNRQDRRDEVNHGTEENRSRMRNPSS